MPKRLTYYEVKSYVENKGYTLISKEYHNNTTLLIIRCCNCTNEYNQTFDRFKKGYQHPNCPNNTNPSVGEHKKQVTLKPIICLTCKSVFQPKKTKTKLCSRECAVNFSRTDEYKTKAFVYGQKGGKISASSQCKRSKNEIYFSELCAKEFEITTNEPYFDGWDADVIIHSEKTAIMWNGIWHYKQIAKTQSLNQVQARDTIKMAIIKKYGYTPYVIKDMGKYNKAFVEQEFEIFKFMRINV